MSTAQEPKPRLTSQLRKTVSTIVIGMIGGLLVFSVTEYYRSRHAQPALKFLKFTPGNGYVDVYATSDSSRPFLVHSCLFRVVKVLKEPEAAPQVARPSQARWLRGPTEATPTTSGGDRSIQRIEPEDVVIPPGPLKPGQWIEARLEPAQVDAYKTQRFRCRLPDADRPGAKYVVEARIGYGDQTNPTWESVPQFEIEAAE